MPVEVERPPARLWRGQAGAGKGGGTAGDGDKGRGGAILASPAGRMGGGDLWVGSARVPRWQHHFLFFFQFEFATEFLVENIFCDCIFNQNIG